MGFEARPGELLAAIRRGLYRMANEVEEAAVGEAPVVTGNLQQSIFTDLDKTRMTVTIGASSNYALYVHEGTGLFGPYDSKIEIRPKNKKALHWGGDPGIYAKSVVSMGQISNPFLTRAIDNADLAAAFLKGFNGE